MKKYLEISIVDTSGGAEVVRFLGDLYGFLNEFNSKLIEVYKDNDIIYLNTAHIVCFQIIKEGEIE